MTRPHLHPESHVVDRIGMTGYMMTTDAFPDAKWVEEVHEALANATLGLVLLHVLGVLVSDFERPAQPVDATQALNLSAGVSNCKVSRGRSFS